MLVQGVHEFLKSDPRLPTLITRTTQVEHAPGHPQNVIQIMDAGSHEVNKAKSRNSLQHYFSVDEAMADLPYVVFAMHAISSK